MLNDNGDIKDEKINLLDSVSKLMLIVDNDKTMSTNDQQRLICCINSLQIAIELLMDENICNRKIYDLSKELIENINVLM